MKKCKICGRHFRLKKVKKYEIVEMPERISALFEKPQIYECFDCPHCGCQIIVNIREGNPYQRAAEARQDIKRMLQGNKADTVIIDDLAAEQNKREGK